MLGESSVFDKEKISYEIRLRKVYFHIKLREYDEALYELAELRKRYPYMSDIYNYTFKIYCIKKKYILAKKVLEEAKRKFPREEVINKNQKYIDKLLEEIDEDIETDFTLETKKEKVKMNKRQEIDKEMLNYYYRILSFRMSSDDTKIKFYEEASRMYKKINS
ncbi:MAG: hypothetical protein E7214_03350 [Clostridium sp.]|nr:hypothetical protein [Clostridium sp.]